MITTAPGESLVTKTLIAEQHVFGLGRVQNDNGNRIQTQASRCVSCLRATFCAQAPDGFGVYVRPIYLVTGTKE